MMEIRLKATSIYNSKSEVVYLQFEDLEIEVLKLYLDNCNRLKLAQIFKRELFPRVEKITWDKETGMSFKVTDFEYSHVCELLHLAMPFFLSREPASFEKIQAIFRKKSRGTGIALSEHLKFLRNTYEHGDYQPYYQVTINDTHLFHDKTIELWLNSAEYHQDFEKALIIKNIEMSLQPDIVRGIFVAQLSGRIRAIFELANLANIVVKNEKN